MTFVLLIQPLLHFENWTIGSEFKALFLWFSNSIFCESPKSRKSVNSSHVMIVIEHTCAYARSAHMHRFLSVRPSVHHFTKIQTRKIMFNLFDDG